MIARDARAIAFKSVSDELVKIEDLITNAASKGALSVGIGEMSDAAKNYFKEQGFEIKLLLEPGKEVTDTRFKIHWEK